MILAHIRSSFAAAFFPRRSEWSSAAVIAALGLVLTFNETLMATSPGRGYLLLLSIAHQPVWAMVLLLFGLARLLVLLINGLWRRSPHLRAGSAFLACLLWTQLVLSFAPTLGFAFTMACGWLATDMFNVFYAMRDARSVDDHFARSKASGSAAATVAE